MKRRQFLKAGGAGAVAAGAALGSTALAAVPDNEEILVFIFIRGGIDGCNFVVPLDDNDHEYYSIMRPTLAIPDSGTGAALQIGAHPFGFNPVAGSLMNLWDAGHLAIVHAAGTPNDIASRSHFDAEKYMELGTPGSVGTLSGFLHRHFYSMAETLDLYPDQMTVPIMAFRNTPPASLLGNNSVLSVYSPTDFRLDNAHWRWAVDDDGYMQLDMLPAAYAAGSDAVSHAGSQALIAEQILRTQFDRRYEGDGAIPYERNSIANRLKDVAQLIKLDLGTRIFALDHGNFDSHTQQDAPNNYDNKIEDLANALEAFLDDLEQSGNGYADRVTIILQSEFGRRLYENVTAGTDHGNGNIMMAIGKKVNGGQFYGDWPGIYPGTADGFVTYANPKNGSEEPELYQGALSVTTDFRRVLSEYLERRCQHTSETLEFVFPGYSGYSPMGIFQPQDASDEVIFSHSFET